MCFFYSPNKIDLMLYRRGAVSGFTFRAQCANDLGKCIARLRNASPEPLNKVVANATDRLKTRFPASSSINRYCQIFNSPC
jgi:hypothetical protein